MKTILFTNARDEAHILEWIAHHLNLGFDTIYVFDHKSVIPIQDLIKRQDNIIVKRIEYENEGLKAFLNQEAIKYAKKNTYDWMLYLDADEFLYLKSVNTIKDFLLDYQQFDLVAVNWLIYGSNYLDKDEPDKTMIEMYTKCANTLSPQIKSFGKVSKLIKPNTPHMYNGPSWDSRVSVSKDKLNPEKPFWNFQIHPYDEVPAYIAHYIYQSYETYIERKVKIPRDDTGGVRQVIDKKDFHLKNNSVINTNLLKYNDSNKELILQIKK